PKLDYRDKELRQLGAQLLLSEVLEYIIKGLGVEPVVNGTAITDANALEYRSKGQPVALEMLDGIADVAYTMYWNALAFGLPLEEAYELVCDNNLEKFVSLEGKDWSPGPVERDLWNLNRGIEWPESVVRVDVVSVSGVPYAVGRDSSGKVRKPSSYSSVDLTPLIAE
ncbi:MAG: hypothetical protein KDD64_07760, partial [Bdellovibrionales bacterium]|nr:hypothetical protein [Bdellovibrionales bacterium]